MNPATTAPGRSSGQGVAVTAAGAEIGRALSERLVASGAWADVCDLDADAVQAVNAQIGGHDVASDTATEPGIPTLVDAVSESLGEIDAWLANTEIDRGRGREADETACAALR